MSLADRYNRGDGRCEALDRYLTYLGDRAGNYWRERTGLGRHVLTQGLYVFSAWSALQHLMLAREPSMLVIVFAAFLGFRGIMPSRGGLVEQIQVEGLGLPRWTFLLLRLTLLGLGLLGLLNAAAFFLDSLIMRTPLPIDATIQLLQGFALTALQASDYIRRTNPLTPSSGGRGRWAA